MDNEQLQTAIDFLLTQAAAQSARMDKVLLALEQDGANIRALARVAELHHERLVRLEGGEA